ncbi:MAG: bifunctional diaminohydroxyphosphoribosylaminopyrimidine deaminase/5-amino-6-(5-phosphoribosylamino)uracil reductase RibD [Fibrobacterota bacterium]
MKKALDLAVSVKSRTSPNPAVGALIVKNGKIIASGATSKPGGPHAEAEALKKAGSKAKGAEMVVTLEPCCFTGRTPPCTDAIIKAGIKKVIAGTADFHEKVNKKGFRVLKKAGIEVISGVEETACREINADFFKFQKERKPFVILKAAATLDGKISAFSGHSMYITSEDSRREVHRMRERADGILIGRGTVEQDNPRLSVRHIKGISPVRFILDSGCSSGTGKRVFAKDGIKTVVFYSHGTPPSGSSAVYVKCRQSKEGVSIPDVLFRMGKMGIMRLLVEGGTGIFSSFIRSGNFDRIVVFTAPSLLGPGRSWTDELPARRRVSSSLELELLSCRKLGPDIETVYKNKEAPF